MSGWQTVALTVGYALTLAAVALASAHLAQRARHRARRKLLVRTLDKLDSITPEQHPCPACAARPGDPCVQPGTATPTVTHLSRTAAVKTRILGDLASTLRSLP